MVVLPYGRQTIEDDDVEAVVAALRAPLLTCGPLVERFEHALAGAIGTTGDLVSACANGTAALHLAYAALDIGPGDEIITTPITFSATAAAAYYVGAAVRVADVDPITGNLDPAAVEPLITARTRAIVPVHLAGQPADLAELVALARPHGIAVVEDACHALGASYRGTPIGGATGSDAVVFSFHPVKHITTGEGGAVVVRSPALKQRIDRLRHHGIARAGTSYDVAELGWNYRLPDVNCALGISQLGKLARFVARRRELAARYRMRLATAPVACPRELADRASAYHLFAVAIDFAALATTRAEVAAGLARAGIATQVHYPPLLAHTLHRERCAGELARPRPGSDRYHARTLTLPLFPAMTDADVDRVADALQTTLRASRPIRSLTMTPPVVTPIRSSSSSSSSAAATLADRTVLVTGGTGSFGRAFVDRALAAGAKKVIVFSRDEQKHYLLDRQIADPRLRCFVGDIRDRDRLTTALRGVDIVVHAAAMKHVPICEYNPIEAVQTNVNGARNVIEAAFACNVERVIALSTDKAVSPANLYGATKLCMEKLLIAANAYAGDRATRFSVVRYGNVMGSAGSVIPLFRAQQRNGSLTITDARMTRFWIEMRDAVNLVLRGLELMAGGEIFIPKLPTTDIETLAEALAPGVPRTTVGIRPGEKLHETLISNEEARRTSDLGDLLVIWPEYQFHTAAARPGRPVPDDFTYSSDSAQPRLGLAETRAMLERVA